MATRNNSDRMRAVVYDRYGPPEVMRLEEVERPVPKDDEVLIKVHATTVNRTDTGLRSAEYFKAEDHHLWRVGINRHGGRAAGQVLRFRRHPRYATRRTLSS